MHISKFSMQLSDNIIIRHDSAVYVRDGGGCLYAVTTLLHACIHACNISAILTVCCSYMLHAPSHADLDVTLGDIFAFITGVDVIPGVGFDHSITVYFEHDSIMWYPTASTCAPSQCLPSALDNYDTMEKDFVDAIKFGSVCIGRP